MIKTLEELVILGEWAPVVRNVLAESALRINPGLLDVWSVGGAPTKYASLDWCEDTGVYLSIKVDEDDPTLRAVEAILHEAAHYQDIDPRWSLRRMREAMDDQTQEEACYRTVREWLRRYASAAMSAEFAQLILTILPSVIEKDMTLIGEYESLTSTTAPVGL